MSGPSMGSVFIGGRARVEARFGQRLEFSARDERRRSSAADHHDETVSGELWPPQREG
jgi:hypothetical protein